ncbi:zinc finger CCCH domain-containing protein 2-like [Ananas comosus]|uniref:Zinc finger CCCH domain-containing protein 2-like n=1 Tax=Ananas comosus TaxID=4615 RepID=A0A6P5F0G4_ANACO|nr:zinc finger CCCH domain-containing protein 2-like [Ananas comosus]
MMMMAMGGEAAAAAAAAARRAHFNPTVEIPPPWSPLDDPAAGALGMGMGMGMGMGLSPSAGGEYAAYLVGEEGGEEGDLPEEADVYASDDFRMYEFKVRRCARGRSHDWTECPFAHPGEKARRRDPRKYHYSGTACPDFRKGSCKRGDACEFAHGVFECWLHPARYRTQPCKDGTACRRRVCFFAHTPDQLRVLPPQHASPRGGGGGAAGPPGTAAAAALDSYDGSPLRHRAVEAAYLAKGLMSSSPTSTLMSPPVSPPSESPPMSPGAAAAAAAAAGVRRASWPAVGASVGDLVASLRQMQLGKVESPPSAWGFRGGGGFTPVGFCSLPTTPTRAVGGGGRMEKVNPEGDAEAVERVESGRALRAKIFEKLSKETPSSALATAPDFGWVSELVK